MTWNDQFLALFDRCLAKYQEGDTDFEKYYSCEEARFLASIGCKPREFFDFVEDFGSEGEPTISTALLVAAVRRDYFHTVQKGIPSDKELTRDDIPTFGEELEGMAYLPRILAKGRAKLHGELDPDLMFGCGGDRNFLKKHGDIHPADFLRHLWASGNEDNKIVHWIKEQQD
ncbi:DUF5069 domain-containing protein [Luteolibacter yonseiensis]|uniref:DUF5069 domain-containing protein n=1 Tax=Luteolibacter yonseiensis TaxID=1144680 RepID=A0A934R4U4_9BACT|nr:DUF5069 domain-containing protein [Luteolibacter yonseiensis]MBK1817181.1 DUF5069 domain-containing protein [Luteolibacter yonseiensis]